MKNFKIVIAFFAILISATTVKAQFVKADVEVSGLTCSMCQLATQKSLKTLDFISDIKPDLNKNIYVLTFKKGAAVDLDMIKKKVKDAGFSVSKLVATFNFKDVKVSNDFHYKYGNDIFHFMNVPSKTLNGETKVTVINKDFISANDFKKFASQTKYACYKTGVMGDAKVFHLTI
ncbi:MAG: cation transporter [Daejeonella sp.]